MKVLAISSSPRAGGNSETLCDAFLQGAAEAGYETEKICLREKKLAPCLGCGACGSTHRCVQKDDAEAVLNALIEADIIVLASPVYFYCMSAQLKMLIDRCLPRYTEIKDKQFYFILTAADPNRRAMDGALAGLRGFLACLPGAQEKGVLYGCGAWDKGDVLGLPVKGEAYQMGKGLPAATAGFETN